MNGTGRPGRGRRVRFALPRAEIASRSQKKDVSKP